MRNSFSSSYKRCPFVKTSTGKSAYGATPKSVMVICNAIKDYYLQTGINVGIKNVTTNEPYFQGHFPTEPVMPGVLQIEAMAQTGGILVLNSLEDPDYSTYILTINNVKFRHKVVPGDTLIMRLELLAPIRRGMSTMQGYTFVGDTLVSEAQFMALIEKNKK